MLALVLIASYMDLDHDLDMEGMLLVVPLSLLQVDQLPLLPLLLVVIPSEFGQLAMYIPLPLLLPPLLMQVDRQDQWLLDQRALPSLLDQR